MFTLRAVLVQYCLTVLLYLIHSTNAGGYTSEETDEKSKSLYSAVTSILGSTDTTKHHHKHTYGDSQPQPCTSDACGGPDMMRNPAPCIGSTGCPIAGPSPNSMPVSRHPQIGYVGGAYGNQYQQTPGYQGGFYGASYGSNYPQYPSSVPAPVAPQGGQVGGTYGVSIPSQPSSIGYSVPYGSGSNGVYNNHQPSVPYGQANGPYGYQGGRGYSVLDHSLKTKSEYTEVGTHNGPLQQAPNGYGYGSGYGGYMGMYNRPGF